MEASCLLLTFAGLLQNIFLFELKPPLQDSSKSSHMATESPSLIDSIKSLDEVWPVSLLDSHGARRVPGDCE